MKSKTKHRTAKRIREQHNLDSWKPRNHTPHVSLIYSPPPRVSARRPTSSIDPVIRRAYNKAV